MSERVSAASALTLDSLVWSSLIELRDPIVDRAQRSSTAESKQASCKQDAGKYKEVRSGNESNAAMIGYLAV